MCFRKAEVVVPLLQGLTKVQIPSHSRFTAKADFPAGLLVLLVVPIESESIDDCGENRFGNDLISSSCQMHPIDKNIFFEIIQTI